MKSLKLRIILIIAALLIVWGLSKWQEKPENVVLNNGTRFEWTQCWFEMPSLQLFKNISCGYLFPSSSIRLPVVVIKQAFWNWKKSPILYLTGGPGSPTDLERQEDIEFWVKWLEINDWPHDFVLFDQRGTGLSQPQLLCPDIIPQARNILSKSLTLEEQLSLEMKAIKQCYQRLHDSNIELSDYTTTNSSRDVGDLMEALGGTDWNLYGVSYGTRLGLTVLRDYPERLRSVILDSVYPPEISELLEMPFLYDNVLTNLFASCKADEECNSSSPNLESSFQKLLAQLGEAPVKLMVLEPDSEQPLPVVLNDHRFMNLVFQALYRWDFIEILPSAIESAERGDYEPLIPLVEDYVALLLDSNFSDAVYLSVECHDSFPETTQAEFMAQVARFPRVSQFVNQYWDYDLCQIWQIGHANQAFREPITSDIPTLFLSGEYDPITPPIWAKKVATRFSHGYVFVFPGIGHGAVDSSDCATMLVREFLQNPEQEPYHECLSW